MCSLPRSTAPANTDTEGFPAWTDEDEAKFIARWPLGARQYLAYMVHACTGVRLGRQHSASGIIHIVSAEKNQAELTIPIHPKLVGAIKACPPSGLHILETTKGKPWVKESYGNEFHDWTVEAGKPKNSHGIRKLCATRVAEAGASELEMMAYFGWADPKMARRYTMTANKKKLAAQAAAKVGASGLVQALFEAPVPICRKSQNTKLTHIAHTFEKVWAEMLKAQEFQRPKTGMVGEVGVILAIFHNRLRHGKGETVLLKSLIEF